MKNYFKYIVLFIILITVGIIGINIYSNKTFQSSKKTQINTKISKENSTKNKEEINKEEENKSSDTKNQETVENKQSNSQNQETTENKKTEENNSTQVSSTSSNNQETDSSSTPSTNESNSTSSEESNYNVLDVDDYSLSSQSQEIETYQKTISPKESNQNDETPSEQEVEILEIEDNYQESNTSNQETETSSKNTQSSSNNNLTNNNTTTTNKESNTNTTTSNKNSKKNTSISTSTKKKNFSHLNRYNQSGKYRSYSVCANGGNTIGGTACGLSSYMATRYILIGKDTDFLAFSHEACNTGLYNGLGTSWEYTRKSGSIYPKKYGIVSKNVSTHQSTSDLYKRTITELNKGNVIVPMIGCGYVTATSQIGGFNSTRNLHYIVIADYDPSKEKPFYVYNPTGINTGWTSKEKLKKYVLSKQCLKNYEVLSKK